MTNFIILIPYVSDLHYYQNANNKMNVILGRIRNKQIWPSVFMGTYHENDKNINNKNVNDCNQDNSKCICKKADNEQLSDELYSHGI